MNIKWSLQIVPSCALGFVSLTDGCYSRITLALSKKSSIFGFRSGLALHCGIDVGAGIIDANYHGPICLLLFTFGEHDFIVSVCASKSFTAFSNFCNLKHYSQVKLQVTVLAN